MRVRSRHSWTNESGPAWPADVLPAIETEESPDWLTSSLPLAGAEYLRLRDLTEVSSPARAAVTVVGLVTVPIDTAGVGKAGVAGVSLVAQLAETLARLEIRLIRAGGGGGSGGYTWLQVPCFWLQCSAQTGVSQRGPCQPGSQLQERGRSQEPCWQPGLVVQSLQAGPEYPSLHSHSPGATQTPPSSSHWPSHSGWLQNIPDQPGSQRHSKPLVQLPWRQPGRARQSLQPGPV